MPEEPDKDSVPRQLAKADAPPEPTDKLDDDARQVGLERKEVDLTLSKIVGFGALALMTAQIAVADYVFFLYGDRNQWKIPAVAIDAWLAAAVVQVVGVVLVIAKYLFSGDAGKKT